MKRNECFRLPHEDGHGGTIYYKTESGRCFAYSQNWDKRRGILVMSPTMRVSNRSYESARMEYTTRAIYEAQQRARS